MGGNCTQGKNMPVLVTGEDFAIDVYLTQDGTNQPFDLSAASQITAILPNADGSFLTKTLGGGGIILVSGAGGHFQVVGNTTDSGGLAPNQATALEIQFVIGGKLTIVNINNAINVVPPAYPGA